MSFPIRKIMLKVHLYLGLVAAAFLVIASLTGSILAFEGDYDRWLHPDLWRPAMAGAARTHQELLEDVRRELNKRGVKALIEEIDLSDGHLAEVFVLTDGRRVFINPDGGRIIAIREHMSGAENAVRYVHELHVMLFAGNLGQRVVDGVTMTILFLVPTGLYLWLAKKRLSIKVSASNRRIIWDTHNVLGFYGCLVILLMAITGLLLAFESPLYWLVHSPPWQMPDLPRSAPPAQSGSTLMPDLEQLLSAADRAVPGAEAYQVRLPLRVRSPVQVLLRGPGLAGHSTVYLDRYRGDVLRVDNLSLLPRSYRAHLIDQAIHIGTIFGMLSKIMVSIASLLFAGLVMTGVLIWSKRVSS